jgi:hypothetical protein
VQLVVLMACHESVVVAPVVTDVLANFMIGAPGGSDASVCDVSAASAWMKP